MENCWSRCALPDLGISSNTCSVFMPIQQIFFVGRGCRVQQHCHFNTPEIHFLDSHCANSHDTSSVPRERWSHNLWLPSFSCSLAPALSSHCLCSSSCVYMVTNLVALSQLNNSLSVYRVPHSTHARQEFTVMCLRRKYIQMFMRHHIICGHF